MIRVFLLFPHALGAFIEMVLEGRALGGAGAFCNSND